MERKKPLTTVNRDAIFANTAKIQQGATSSLAKSCEALADFLFDLNREHEQNGKLTGNPDKDLLAKLLSEKKKDDDSLLGALGKCRIYGCDVHKLTLNDEIIQHIGEREVLHTEFAKARELLRYADNSTIGILVYKDRLERVHLDGTVETISG
ncbi:MAG: hypothetical protein RJB66_48 [Pseudomonadota bacterium]|jgi:hypothetical protein